MLTHNSNNKKLIQKRKKDLLLFTSPLALMGCGGGGETKSSTLNARDPLLPNKERFALTEDTLIDSMTVGSKWDFDEGQTYAYAIAGSRDGVPFSEPALITPILNDVFDNLSQLTGLQFTYSGEYLDQASAYEDGVEFVTSLDGEEYNQTFFSSSGTVAIGGFPITDPLMLDFFNLDKDFPGNIILNYAHWYAQQSYGLSTADGGAFKALFFHEFGHAFGLKHPHDDGDAGRPIFGEYGGLSKILDDDVYTVMSYEGTHGGINDDGDLARYDPATFMVLDVLTLQYLYGTNTDHAIGDDTYSLTDNNSYRSIWDPNGNNIVDFSGSAVDWSISLPFYNWSENLGVLTGAAVNFENIYSDIPTDLVWLIGQFSSAYGGKGNDTLYGNAYDNQLFGNEGNDSLEGWEGNDELSGGSGDDIFYFAIGWGVDRIKDFDPTIDEIILLNEFLQPIDFDRVKIEITDNDTVFELNSSSQLIVENFNFFEHQKVLGEQELSSSAEADRQTQDAVSTDAIGEIETEENGTFITADTIDMGSAIKGQLGSSDDIDYFKFNITQASTFGLVFDAPTNSSNNNYFTASILDSSGNFLSSHQFSADKVFSTALASAGTYYVQVSGSYLYDDGQYSLLGSLTAGTSSHEIEKNDTRTTANDLSSGQRLEGQLWWTSDMDYYRVSIDGPSAISVDFDAPTNSSYYDYFTVSLLDASGSVLASKVTGKDVTFEAGVDTAGDYFLLVEDAEYLTTDPYTISISVDKSTDAIDEIETEENGTFITADTLDMGSAIKGQLGSSDDIDYFKFNITQASTFGLVFDAPTNSPNNNYFTASILDSSGNFLSSHQFGADTVFSTALASAGTYYVQVSGSYLYDDGQYSLLGSLTAGTNSHEIEKNDTRTTANDLSSGQRLEGQLWWTSDMDYYRVSIDGPSAISVDFDAPTNSSYYDYFTVSLLDASGSVLASKVTGKDVTFEAGVDTAGDYFLLVEDAEYLTTDPYTISISVDKSTDAIDEIETEENGTFITADTLDMGSAIKGQLGSSYDIDYFKFNITQASTFGLVFDAPTNSPNNNYFTASILDSSGNFLSSHQFGADKVFSTALASAGTYYVQVSGSYLYDDGQYSLLGSLTAGTSSHEIEKNDTRTTANDLSSGQRLEGQLWWTSDMDYYRVSIDGPSAISVDFDAPTNSSYYDYFTVSLLDASGSVLASKVTGKDVTFEAGVDTAGDYFLLVEDAEYLTTDPYTISISVDKSTDAIDEIETEGSYFTGTSGDDFIIGTDGNDTLQGGLGNDYLTGGAGQDIFYFLAGWGHDTITDYSDGDDTLIIEDDFLNLLITEEIVNGHTIYTLSDGSSLTLLNYESSSAGPEQELNNNTAETEDNGTRGSADTIEMGKAISGQIGSTSDLDFYTFTTTQASTLQVVFDAPTSSSYNDYFSVAVLDANGNTLSSHEVGSDLTFSSALSAAGTYYIQIADADFHDDGQYSVTASLSNGTAGYETESNNSSSVADTLNSGSSMTGQILNTSDTDYFGITTDGAATVSISFDAPTNSSYNDYFKVSLQTATGTVLASQDTGKDISFDAGVDAAGDYYIAIEDSDFHVTDEYTVSASITAAAINNNTAETEDNGTRGSADTIEMGKAISGQIGSTSDLDFYTFTTTQASTLQVVFDAPTSSSYNDYFSVAVLDANGNTLSSHEVGSDLTFSSALSAAGTYYIQIADADFHDDGQYSVTASLSNGTAGYETESNNSSSVADTLNSGSSMTGQILSTSDTDYFGITTDGAATVSISFDAPTNSSYNDYFKVSLQTATGTVLASQDTGKDISFDAGVDAAGDYYIAIEDSDFHVTDEYTVSASITAAAINNNTAETEDNGTRGSADTIEMGKAISGQIGSTSDLDFYTFTTTQASTLQVVFDAPTSSSYNDYFSVAVLDANGNTLSSHEVGSDLTFSSALSAAGTYYIQIADADFHDDGQYSVTASLSNGTAGYETESNNSSSVADTLNSGSSMTGQILSTSDTDYFGITTDGAATVSISFDAPTNSSYNDYFKVSLQTATGTVLASQDTGKDISFDAGVDAAGDYYIAIEDSDFHVTDEYTVSASITAAAINNNTAETEDNGTRGSADTIEMGKAISGQIGSTSDLDFYTFTTTQASTLQVVFDAPTSSSYNDYFSVAVLDANGNTLSSHEVGSDLTFSSALSAAGTYYIQIADADFHDDGQYSVTASLSNGTAGYETESNNSSSVADTLNSGSSMTGQILSTSDTDYFGITTDGAATVSISFDAPTNSSYNDYFKVSLQTATGTVLASQDTGKDISFDAGVDAAGDYYIAIEDSDFHVTDEYTVSASITAAAINNNTAETEDNGTRGSADTIEMGKAISGQIGSTSDLDFYTFTTTQASTLQVVFDAPTSSSYNDYFSVAVLDANGNTLSSHEVGSDLTFSSALSAAGTYYIQIADADFHDDGQYSVTASLSNGTAGYETESNNSSSVADTLNSGSSMTGQILSTSDTDYFGITTDGAATVSISFDAPTNSSYNDYFKVSLQTATGTVLASQDTGKDISFDAGVDAAGDYYIAIEDSDFHVTDEYTVSASITAAAINNNTAETEDNGTRGSADTIEMGKAISGQIGSTSDLDFYTFTTTQASTLQVVFDAPTSSSYNDYFSVAVLDANGNTLSSHEVGSDLTFSSALSAAGTYYIQIADADFHDDGQYSVTASLSNGTAGYETESNNSSSVADTLNSGSSMTGQILSTSDTDYFGITTDGAATVSISFDAPTNSSYNDYFKVSLQTATGTVLASQDTGKDISFDAGVDAAGDYYIAIEDSDFHVTDEYTVSSFIM